MDLKKWFNMFFITKKDVINEQISTPSTLNPAPDTIEFNKEFKCNLNRIDIPFSSNHPSVLGKNNADRIEAFIEDSFRAEYFTHVKERVMKHHPYIDDIQYDWLLLELKRFFFMTALFKSTPMYSPLVDILWHEMLMFTADYQQFCNSFCDHFIHHRPNVTRKNEEISSEDRAFFDFVYSLLFKVDQENQIHLRAFHRYSLSEEVLLDFSNSLDSYLLKAYFNVATNDQFASIQELLILLIKQSISRSQSSVNDYPGMNKVMRNSLNMLASVGFITPESSPLHYSRLLDSQLQEKTETWKNLVGNSPTVGVSKSNGSKSSNGSKDSSDDGNPSSSCSGSSCSSNSCSSSSCSSCGS